MLILSSLEKDLAKLTGFAAASLQPNAGSQGEYTGLMVIQAYHRSKGTVANLNTKHFSEQKFREIWKYFGFFVLTGFRSIPKRRVLDPYQCPRN